MSHITVADGDFLEQLVHNVSVDQRSDPNLDITILKSNRFAVYKTHLDYLHAGAKIIRTNTLRLTPVNVAKTDGGKITSLITTAVELAQKAVFKYYEQTGGDAFDVDEFKRCRAQIAGCCGSYSLSTTNSTDDFWNYISPEKIARCHRERIQTLLNAGVDLLALDQISSRMEAEVLVELLREFRTVQVLISFICINDRRLHDGSDFLEIAQYCCRLLPGRIIAVGGQCPNVNCGISLLTDIHIRTPENERIPMMAYTIYKDNIPDGKDLMYYLKQYAEVGVSCISGDFDSDASDIKSIVNALTELRNSTSSNSSATTSKECTFRNEGRQSKL